MRKVSFDFDYTLGHLREVQEYATELISKGFDVHIVTSRFDSLDKYDKVTIAVYGITDLKEEHEYLFEVADNVGIKRENIHFTNMELKYKFFENKDFVMHLDDSCVEIDNINAKTKTIAVNVTNSNWKYNCNKVLKI